ncbi:16S rRNA (adenine(1518)-N(6)/adenine(1519)-N(6))-dimethyltransferase RsmA [Rubellicoccus peritrichatus]|uniref:Ribosomal RNA small subunit methyltransferase A n=1 Tax=Rubellicoccus peritrichatus TaxID=3080537 RepID=A0AAQ3LDL2_9BACT|nr:16S rRNA (adenine(1518)-N(6)/adenine(1519)-N(6))-dimethyltransferase RsmA [Puniceicoccus sp. CR14]WOO40144.1 16S rRNA (adenine(1518)-N(6)/adenine(1519)-N(6))-dimethyltransferase RsmA [Puniceicoccus sp. CR14]
MLTLSQTRKILAKLGHEPRKALGQNYLVDANIVRKSLELAEVKAGDVIVEVGPGLGTLTQSLLEAGAKVFAIEADKTMFAYQTENLLKTYLDDLNITLGDAVDKPRAGLPDEIASRGDFKIVANLPYAISTPWLETLIAGPLPKSITVMVQKEAGDRFMAESGTKQFGAVSIFLQSAYRRAKAHSVSSSCFHPAPKVDSMIVHLERLNNPFCFTPVSRKVIRRIFTQRRKQIGGIVRRLDEREQLESWLEEIASLGISPQSRPEQVPLEAWQKLTLE